MSTDLTVYEARVLKLEAMLEALQKTREDLLERIGVELGGSHVEVRSMNGHRFVWTDGARKVRELAQDLEAVCQMHAGVHREWSEAIASRDRVTKTLPPEAQAAIAGLRLLPGGGGS